MVVRHTRTRIGIAALSRFHGTNVHGRRAPRRSWIGAFPRRPQF